MRNSSLVFGLDFGSLSICTVTCYPHLGFIWPNDIFPGLCRLFDVKKSKLVFLFRSVTSALHLVVTTHSWRHLVIVNLNNDKPVSLIILFKVVWCWKVVCIYQGNCFIIMHFSSVLCIHAFKEYWIGCTEISLGPIVKITVESYNLEVKQFESTSLVINDNGRDFTSP